MSVVMCSRCDRFVDLDYSVDDMVVLRDGMNWSCRDCLQENEICPECDDPIWDCQCVKEEKKV